MSRENLPPAFYEIYNYATEQTEKWNMCDDIPVHTDSSCGLVVSAPLGTEQVVSSIPGSVGYISHVHWAYDYLGPFGVLWIHMAWHKNCVKKIIWHLILLFYDRNIACTWLVRLVIRRFLPCSPMRLLRAVCRERNNWERAGTYRAKAQFRSNTSDRQFYLYPSILDVVETSVVHWFNVRVYNS